MDDSFKIVLTNTMQMLLDRGYIFPKCAKKILETPQTLFDDYDGTFFVKKQVGAGQYKKVMVFFSIEKFGIKHLRLKIEEIKELQIDHVIFVVDNKFTSHGHKLLQEHLKLEEEIFYFEEMLVDAVNHHLVPKHELLTPEESEKFLANFSDQVPCIKINDRICRHFNGKINQIFRIYRKNELYYRIVIA